MFVALWCVVVCCSVGCVVFFLVALSFIGVVLRLLAFSVCCAFVVFCVM